MNAALPRAALALPTLVALAALLGPAAPGATAAPAEGTREARANVVTVPVSPARLARSNSNAGTFWSLTPLASPPRPPSGAPADQPAHPIDAFIRAKLAGENLAPSPEADRRILARRLSYDLTGLP